MAGEAAATAVVEATVQSCFTMIGHYISCTRKYKRNMESLKDELINIEAKRSTLLKDVDTAKKNAEDIRPDVQVWLEKYEELKSQGDQFFKITRHFHVSCLGCKCPNLKSRYSASSEATEMTSLITKHLEESKFDKVGQQPQLGPFMPFLSRGEFHDFGSRTEIVEEVKNGLKDESIYLIGLCGMGGVGKTTLVKQIAKEVMDEKLFDEVAFAVVSKDANVEAIQRDLASRLDLKSIENERNIERRAALLLKRLTDGTKTILVILDDIWKELDLRLVGIPDRGVRKGFKILVTSRLDRVCVYMNVQKRLQLRVLSKDESWNLFKMTAEISDDTILEIAEEVSQKCGGLPLAIVTVGKLLRNKKDPAFYRVVLGKLSNASGSSTSEMEDVLYSCIKLSYDFLESDEHKLVLLLCSLFPEDFEIAVQDLVRYARGLFDSLKSMAEARDRVTTIIDDLLNCYLLLPGEEEKHVKLHDIVRGTCRYIGEHSVDDHISLKVDDLGRMFLRLDNKKGFQTSGFFSLNALEDTKNKELNFSNMQELTVLVLNHITTSLPSSLQFMSNLHTLSLHYCKFQGDFTGIGRLKMLRVLSFFSSKVETFPMEVAELINLEFLDLRFDLDRPTKLPLGTLSSLIELEELYLGKYVLGGIAGAEEVGSLKKLHTIQLLMRDNNCLECLLKNLDLSKLIRFHIRKEQITWLEHNYQIKENKLDYYFEGPHHIDLNLLKELMGRVESFRFNGKGLTNGVAVFEDGIGFPKLKDLYLASCDMKYLYDATNHPANGTFGKLETLAIHSSDQLEELIHMKRPFGILEVNHENLNCPFGNLRNLEITNCGKIKSLFPKSMVKQLRNLDYLEVSDCEAFERIVTSQEDEEEECSQIYQFPTLQELNLRDVPLFVSHASWTRFDQITLHELEHLDLNFNDSIEERGGEADKHEEVCSYLSSSLPNVRTMHICSCNNLFTIAKTGLVHGFQELIELRVAKCSSVEVVFDFEEMMNVISAEQPVSTSHLGRLKLLSLITLPKLEHICRMLPKETRVFGNLKTLEVKECDSLRYLLTPAIANMLQHLEQIFLEDNALMEAILGGDEIGMPNDGDKILLGGIVLPKLKYLKVENLPKFIKLCCCSPDITLELPSLIKLKFPFTIIYDTFTEDQLSCLTSFGIGRIGNRKYPFTRLDEFLESVRELELCDGELMEALIGSDKPDGEDAPNCLIVFPELCKLVIDSLPNFRNLCFSPDLNLELPSLTELIIKNCPIDILTREAHALQNLTKLELHRCGGISKHLLSFSTTGVLVHLEELELYSNKSIEAIFGGENSDGEEIPNKTIVLPKLRQLHISYLPNFRMLCSSLNVNVELPSLIELYIVECPKMSKLCSGQLDAPLLKYVSYWTYVTYGTYDGFFPKKVDLETFTNSWLKDCESMTRCLHCTFYQHEICHHFDEQKS